MKLKNKKILLTGALGTLGVCQAKKLAKEGGKLFLLDKDSQKGEVFASEISDHYGIPARFINNDLNDLDTTRKVISDLVEEANGIDILINNAAQIINKPFEEFSREEYENMIRINSSAPFVLTQVIAPGMKKKNYGKIVNFCSLTLNGGWEGFTPYVASKGAILGLTKNLARELGSFHINVNAVSPGAIESEAERRVFADKLEEYNHWVLENQSLKFRGQPEHIANLVLFLVSPESDYITGQNIRIDGGWQ